MSDELVRVSFRVDPAVASAMEEAARQSGVGRSEIYREAVSCFLQHIKIAGDEYRELLTEDVKWRMMGELAISMRVLIENKHPELKPKISNTFSDFKKIYGIEN